MWKWHWTSAFLIVCASLKPSLHLKATLYTTTAVPLLKNVQVIMDPTLEHPSWNYAVKILVLGL